MGQSKYPEEIVDLDSKINAVILEFTMRRKNSVRLKQLAAHPWDALDEKIVVGDKIKGKVVVVADYGAFVEVQTGRGLNSCFRNVIHIFKKCK